MTRLSNFIKEDKDVEVTEMISENRWQFTDFLKEDEKSPSGAKDDNTGTGVKPEDSWKTPEQMEQDEKDKAAMQKDKDEQEIQAGIDKEEDRYNLIRSKLGRLLATPEELAELDKEKEEEEKAEIKKTEKEKKENITETALRKTLKNGDRHQSAIDQAHSMNLRHVGHGNWADSKGDVKGKIVNDKFIPIEKGDVSGEKGKIDTSVSKVKNLVKMMTAAEKQKKIEKGWEKKKKELDNKRKERLNITTKGENKKKVSKEIKPEGDETKKKKEPKIPTGSKAEPAIADAINGKSNANPILAEVVKRFQKAKILPKDVKAEVIGGSAKFDLSSGWEGGSKIPKTDIKITDKKGNLLYRVSVKTGAAQLMSGMKGETKSVLTSSAKDIKLDEDPTFKKMVNTVNHFVTRMKLPNIEGEHGAFGELHTPEAEKIRSFNKKATKMFSNYIEGNPRFLESIVKESMTGQHKFGKKSEATADTLLYLDPKGNPDNCSFVKITNKLIKKISKEVKIVIGMKTAGGYTGTALRLQTPALVASVEHNYFGEHLVEDIQSEDDMIRFFDLFEMQIEPPEDDDLEKILKESTEETDMVDESKMRIHLETPMEEDD